MFWYHHIATIPVTANITLVPGQLLWANDQWTMDLATHEVRRSSEPRTVLFHEHKRIEIDYLDDSQQLAVSIQDSLDHTPVKPKLVDMWGTPTVLSGRYLINLRRAELQVVDFEADNMRVLSTPISPIQNSGASVGNEGIIPLQGTNRFVRDNFASGTNDFSLYEIQPSEIRLLSTWPGVGSVHFRNAHLYNYDVSQQHIDVHSAVDGTFLDSIEIGYSRGLSIFRDVVTKFDEQLAHCTVFDLEKKQPLNLPSDDFYPALVLDGPWLVLRSAFIGKSRQLLVYDRRTAQVVREIETPSAIPYSNGLGIYDQQHFYYRDQAHGVSATLVDLNTGQLLARWSPYAWISWSSLLFAPAIASWIIAWSRVSRKAAYSPWLDLLLLGNLLAWMASYPTTESPWIQAVSFLSCTALHLAMIQAACWHLVMAQNKLITRLNILVITVGISQSFFVSTVGEHESGYRWLLLTAAGFGLGYLSIIAYLLQRGGWQLRPVGVPAGQSLNATSPTKPTSIGDIFMVTIAMAILINALRMTWHLAPGGQEYPNESLRALCGAGALGGLGLVLGLMPNPRTVAIALCLAGLTAILVVGYRQAELISGIPPLQVIQQLMYPELPQSQAWDEYQLFTWHRWTEAMLIALVAPLLASLPLRRQWAMLKRVDQSKPNNQAVLERA